MKSGIKVVSPASVSNLACGFDALGMALDIPCDEIIGTWSDMPGIRITEITGAKKGIPHEPDHNVAARAAKALLAHVGEPDRGLELRIHKHIPAGSGLGSSGSSAAAAAVLVNEMLGRPLERRDLLPFAIEGELLASVTPVGDNVLPALIGGLVLVRDIATADYHRIYMPPGLFMAILLPDMQIATREARGILRPEVLFTDAVRQAANLGAFVIGMHNGDLDLIGRSMQDLLVEHQRAPLVPLFGEVKAAAMTHGALACSISGAGPAIFALCKERLEAEGVANAMADVYAQQKRPARSFVAGINREGAALK
jgi:homoserine kinase